MHCSNRDRRAATQRIDCIRHLTPYYRLLNCSAWTPVAFEHCHANPTNTTQFSSTTILAIRPANASASKAPARSGDAKPTALFLWSRTRQICPIQSAQSSNANFSRLYSCRPGCPVLPSLLFSSLHLSLICVNLPCSSIDIVHTPSLLFQLACAQLSLTRYHKLLVDVIPTSHASF